jgi:regulator of replication initiation timing
MTDKIRRVYWAGSPGGHLRGWENSPIGTHAIITWELWESLSELRDYAKCYVENNEALQKENAELKEKINCAREHMSKQSSYVQTYWASPIEVEGMRCKISEMKKENAELRARVEELEGAIRTHHDVIMDNCVMSETDPGDDDHALWSYVKFNVTPAF